MKASFKNKTVASLLATLVGSLGLHRFYIYGRRDFGAWVYFAATCIYVALVFGHWLQGTLGTNVPVLFPLPAFAGFMEALVIGVTLDERWDARHNLGTTYQSHSGWPLIMLMVLTLAGGFIAFITSMARATDLLLTNGSFG